VGMEGRLGLRGPLRAGRANISSPRSARRWRRPVTDLPESLCAAARQQETALRIERPRSNTFGKASRRQLARYVRGSRCPERLCPAARPGYPSHSVPTCSSFSSMHPPRAARTSASIPALFGIPLGSIGAILLTFSVRFFRRNLSDSLWQVRSHLSAPQRRLPSAPPDPATGTYAAN
jgi:hypothetical protein